MLILLIISFGILSRLVIHTPNFSPVLALALFSGMYLKGRYQPVLVPLALMIVTDLINGPYGEMFFVWGSIALISIFGSWLKQRKSFTNVLGGSVISAVIFFLVTNFASWIVLYPHTIAGLRQCYILAIPFFRSSLLSTVAYSLVFYTAYEWIVKRCQGSILARFV